VITHGSIWHFARAADDLVTARPSGFASSTTSPASFETCPLAPAARYGGRAAPLERAPVRVASGLGPERYGTNCRRPPRCEHRAAGSSPLARRWFGLLSAAGPLHCCHGGNAMCPTRARPTLTETSPSPRRGYRPACPGGRTSARTSDEPQFSVRIGNPFAVNGRGSAAGWGCSRALSSPVGFHALALTAAGAKGSRRSNSRPTWVADQLPPACRWNTASVEALRNVPQ
jgi:hypothetical protein